MTTDLFQIYKMYIQRVRRNPGNPRLKTAKETMEYLIKNDLTTEEMVSIAEGLRDLEKQLRVRTNYGARIIKALNSGSYCIDVPYQVLHKWQENDDSEGWVYLATSVYKDGEVKIGATSIPIWKREYSYEHRWGYPIDVVWKRKVRRPFGLEARLKEEFRSSLVSGLTYGDSNEWYYGDVEQMSELIDEYISHRDG